MSSLLFTGTGFWRLPTGAAGGAGAAGALLQLPRIGGAAAEPAVALRQLAQGELGDEDGARRVQRADHIGVGVDHLLHEGAGAPGGLRR